MAVTARKHSSKSAGARRGGAAFTITEECERLFCETLKTIFLGEGDLDLQDSLVMGSPDSDSIIRRQDITAHASSSLSSSIASEASPRISSDSYMSSSGGSVQSRLLSDWLEMWDYAGGARFRGFIVDTGYEKSMFVFFDKGVLGSDLKPGLMALLELCSVSEIDCSKLVVCVDRKFEEEDSKGLLRDLGWVGFEPITLDEWVGDSSLVSDKWMLLGMEA